MASMVRVHSLAGKVLAEVTPKPADVATLKAKLEAFEGLPRRALQKLLTTEGACILSDSDPLPEGELNLMMVVDESPMFTWDVEGNPAARMLQAEGAIVSSPNLSCDYCNVLTKEPICQGKHYFQFVMHHIGDEQWCGLVSNPERAGTRYSGRALKGWTYYCGRMRTNSSSIVDGLGALHAEGKAVKQFKKLQPKGDVIGMLVDLDAGAVVFDLNEELQGACAVPKEPLWVLTHMDTRSDVVELRKPSLLDAPPKNLDALEGALLDVSKGVGLRGWVVHEKESESEQDDMEEDEEVEDDFE